MIETREVEIPTRTRTEERVVCGLCGKMTEWGESDWPAKDGDHFTREVVTISLESVTRYPGGEGNRDGGVYDVCPECFVEKVNPLLKSLGLVARKTECDW